ncbi:DUF1685 family protein [Quillaja saponaria]|uniref:DUF1685 family protein n=1 Tax=Quillaja saponaria TaxID=32244 RepID=A0AAD7KWG8_QUISA|nr:DUF1685 family protein [Quillaja saponaria]
MEADEVMKLFDSCWFELEILKKRPVSLKSSSFSANPDHEIQEKPSKPELSRIQTIHIRSMSDQFDSMTSFKYDSLSPDTVLFTSKLQTILSGKEVTEIESPKQRNLKIEVLPKKNTQSKKKEKK